VKIKQLPFLFALQSLLLTVQAQDFFTGKLTDKQGTKEIFYDRTQNDITGNVFQTVYKITDSQKKPLYTVSLTHDRVKGSFLISIKGSSGDPTGSRFTYDRAKCGLIISNLGGFDTIFASNYDYLFSFTDTLRTYPVIHQLKTYDRKNLFLDPLTKLRIKKHIEAIRKLKDVPEQPITFNGQLFKLRDSLYAKHYLLTEKVNDIRKQIEEDVSTLMRDNKVEKDIKRYVGEKRSGNPHGKGLLVLNANVYDGIFVNGKFANGKVVLLNDTSEYCGESSGGEKSGTGWLKFKNGSYLLGRFEGNNFTGGVSLQKTGNEIYFGSYNGKRNGYGELQNTAGGKYAGEFRDDRLVKGYAKEVDPFGYYSYSQIQNGKKIPVEAETAEEFFGLTLSADK